MLTTELKSLKALLWIKMVNGQQEARSAEVFKLWKTNRTHSFSCPLHGTRQLPGYQQQRNTMKALVCVLLPVLSVLCHGPLVPPGHLTLITGFAGRTHFNGGVLKWCGCYCHFVSTLLRGKNLNHFYTATRDDSLTPAESCIHR